MNIGIVCYPTYGGSGVLAVELGLALAQRGHKIHFISYAMPARLESYVQNIFYHEVEISRYPLFEFPLYTPALTSKIVEVARFAKLDLVHAHYAIPHAMSALMAKDILGKNSLATVTTLHGTDITLVGLEPAFLPIMKHTIEHSDGVTAVSNFLKQETISNYNIEKEIEVIYNFADLKKFHRRESSDIKKNVAPNGEKILIHVSNFRPLKRVADTVKILEEVRKQIPCKLLLVGDGPDRSSVENLCRELDLCDDVHFLGKQTELASLLSVSDVFLLTSETESFGLSVLEAMACEVPVVSTNVGGVPELIVAGETGFMSNVGSIEKMANNVMLLLTNEERRKLFGKNALKRAQTYFDIKTIIPKYEQFYEKVLNNSKIT
ncbi:MAG: N-acetyl-alpha-D-glucosaminyl L-malate synthase BshA [Ignavibacteriales bacterium]|nr:N-acetyl-alpha-D-glucosaminyl L-malate synthase BshA [Ignavibacteriales bacterium]